MTENENELGYAVVDLVDRRLIIHELSLTDTGDLNALDPQAQFLLDTLMRSAASWGETKGADFIETRDSSYNDFLLKKGFDTDQNHAFTKMSTIIHYTGNELSK